MSPSENEDLKQVLDLLNEGFINEVRVFCISNSKERWFMIDVY